MRLLTRTSVLTSLSALALAWAVPAQAQTVAVYGAPSTASWNTDVQSKIQATGLFTAVDVVNVNTSTPTVAQMQAYDALFVYSDTGFQNGALLGDNLAAYMQSGGGVVMATFAFYSSGALGIAGNVSTLGYLPFTLAGQAEPGGLTMIKDVPGDPIFLGVATLNGGTSSYHNSSITTTTGTTLLAHWSNGQPLVATKEVGGGRIVGLNFYPPSDTVRADFWLASTDGGRLMGNSLLWATQAGANGSQCTVGGSCLSGNCVDGVCCDTACGGGVAGDCQACSITAGGTVNGTCGPLSNAVAPTVMCRASTDLCDANDFCSAGSTTCTDGFVAMGTTCRASIGSCDVTEACDGTTASCPADAAATPGTACGGMPSGACDAQDTCSGTVGATATCDALVLPMGTTCRASVGDCDVGESCDGTTTACPADAAATPGTACGGAPSGACDAQDTCSGTVGATATCDALFASAGTACSDSSACTMTDTCDGSGTCSAGTTVDCDDNNPCTMDGCVAMTGCMSLPVTDGTVCPGGTCQGGACQVGTGGGGTGGGAGTGGGTGTGGGVGTGGGSGTGGGAGTGGDSGTGGGGSDETSADDGCGCQLPGSVPGGSGGALALLGVGLAALSRRRRSRRA